MIVALDLETTGLDSKKDTIIEVALIKIDTKTFQVLDTYNTFVNPEIQIPEIISEITSITQKDVEDAPMFSDIRDTIQDFIGGLPILGHNTNFDRDFLISHGINLKNNLVLDTFFLANFLLSGLKSLNLGFIANHLGVSILSEHRAIDDTKGTVAVYEKLIEKLRNLPKQQQQIFRYISDISRNTQAIYYRENYLGDIEKISEEQIIEMVLSTISKKRLPHEIQQKYEENTLDIDTIFQQFDDFEVRENQKKMAHIVYKNLLHSQKTVIEAPTGVGKTFAYLIPSIAFSLEMGEQVFISTSTKTLQDQIFFKDLSYLSQNMKENFSFTKLKGKRNYISLFAFFSSLENTIEPNQTGFVLKILFWLLQTQTGELDELDYYGEEFSFLHDINATLPFTFHSDNPYAKNEFIIHARDRAKTSNIVIINNNILFQDIVSEGRILGNVKNLILDESHNLEDVVTQSLKKGFSLTGVEKIFESLIKTLKKEEISTSQVIYIYEKLSFSIAALLEEFSAYIHTKVSATSRYKNVLVQKDFFTKFDTSYSLYEKISSDISDIIDFTQTLSSQQELLIGREISYLQSVQDILDHIFSLPEVFSTIIPIASIKDNYGVILEYTFLSPGEFLEKNLWNKLDSVVLTSATLEIEGSYSYIQNMLSLNNFDFVTLSTDFDYKKQSLLFIPTNLGSVKYNIAEILQFLHHILPIVGGRTLILVTAFSMIQQCFVSLNGSLKSQGMHLLAQSVSGGKQKQIDFFKSHSDSSVLIGTDTFWEGVDIKGDDLQYLIIHKIPFMVPSDPIFQARSLLFQDAFSQYSIPKSILKLKQGFGRLIRTKTDSGMVIFLDDRILSTRWGQRYYAAFPDNIRVRKSTTEKLIEILKK